MAFVINNLLANLSNPEVVNIRLASMFVVLIGGLVSGYLANSRWGLSKYWVKRIMSIVLVFFFLPIAMLVIWQMQLSRQLIWLPIIGVALMLVGTVLSAGLFSFFKLNRKRRLTLILAGGLSNIGYTGGAIVCYALFGITGLALANMYYLLCLPTFYLLYLPFLKVHDLKMKELNAKLKLSDFLDFRCLGIPAIIIAIALNLTNLKMPDFVSQFHIIDIFVYIASSLSFFAIGLQVNLSQLKNYKKIYFSLSAVKFILIPALAVLIIWLLMLTGQNLTEQIRKVIIVLSATPTAVLVVTMSNVFDLDGPLASTLWVITMGIFVAIVVPILFFILA